MAETPHRETMSSLLATHTAVRVARDIGYPRIAPPTPEPAAPDPPTRIPLFYLRVPAKPRFARTVFDALVYLLIAVAVLLSMLAVAVYLQNGRL